MPLSCGEFVPIPLKDSHSLLTLFSKVFYIRFFHNSFLQVILLVQINTNIYKIIKFIIVICNETV